MATDDDKATIGALKARVAHLEAHVAFMAKAFARERLDDLMPESPAEIEAKKLLLQARVDQRREHGENLAAAIARDEAAIQAMSPPAVTFKKVGAGGSAKPKANRPAQRRGK